MENSRPASTILLGVSRHTRRLRKLDEQETRSERPLRRAEGFRLSSPVGGPLRLRFPQVWRFYRLPLCERRCHDPRLHSEARPWTESRSEERAAPREISTQCYAQARARLLGSAICSGYGRI